MEMHRGADVPVRHCCTVPPRRVPQLVAARVGSQARRLMGCSQSALWACARMEVNEVVCCMWLLYSRCGAGLLDERNLQLSRVPAPTQVSLCIVSATAYCGVLKYS